MKLSKKHLLCLGILVTAIIIYVAVTRTKTDSSSGYTDDVFGGGSARNI